MSGHTPGPWSLIHFGGPQIGHKPTGEAVCTMWGSEDDPNDPILANANLICAAPELLDLLAEADRRIAWESVGLGNTFADRVEAAIAKAEGRA